MRSSTACLTCLSITFLLAVAFSSRAGDPCVSGLTPGQKPGPYSSIVAVGAERGKTHCFICETAERPAIIVFARHLDDPLVKLVVGIDKAVADNNKAELRGWVTFLNEDHAALDPQIMQWAKKNAVRNVPMGIFEDVVGPPTYRLHRDADVTVMLYVKNKVVSNYAFRSGELTEERIADILKQIPKLVEPEKK
jgi:hypothetical protein